MREHSNSLISRIPKDLLIVLLLLVTSSFAFGLGMLAERQNRAGEGKGFSIEETALSSVSVPQAAAATAAVVAATQVTAPAKGSYVASKNGETYYLTTCKSASRIKSENRVYFATAEEARNSGRRPAANCPGL